jgi:hypothetical protein
MAPNSPTIALNIGLYTAVIMDPYVGPHTALIIAMHIGL